MEGSSPSCCGGDCQRQQCLGAACRLCAGTLSYTQGGKSCCPSLLGLGVTSAGLGPALWPFPTAARRRNTQHQEVSSPERGFRLPQHHSTLLGLLASTDS